jgi:hypothetical protein
MMVPPAAASDGRVIVGSQPARLADALIDVYEYGTTKRIATTAVLHITHSRIYEKYLTTNGAIKILPDDVQFDSLENRLKSPKCLGKYIAGTSIIWDAVRHSVIVDTDDLVIAVRYQFSTYRMVQL